MTEPLDVQHTVGEGREGWVCSQDDDALGVAVECYGDVQWQVTVAAAELVRAEPLESRLRAAVADAIAAVEGVQDAYEEDREVWSVDGEPSGDALARAVAQALQPLADELRAHIAAL